MLKAYVYERLSHKTIFLKECQCQINHIFKPILT